MQRFLVTIGLISYNAEESLWLLSRADCEETYQGEAPPDRFHPRVRGELEAHCGRSDL